jgi:hypothetical protein
MTKAKPTLEQWMQGAKDCEVVWDEYMDAAYAWYMAQSEAYAFEDNYEPFEIKELATKMSQASMKYLLKHVNRS